MHFLAPITTTTATGEKLTRTPPPSQGSAVMTNAIQALDATTKSQVTGVVMYGFTRNAQDKGQVPGFSKAQTKVFCATGDLVCLNTLTITPAHLTYGVNAPAGAKFLAGTA